MGKFFLGQEETRSPVVRKAERRNLKGVTKKSVGEAVYELLTPDLNGALEAQWIVSPPGHDTSATPFRHSGEEFGIVLSGRKDIFLDGESYTLEEGDSITFSSDTPHWYKNSYEEVCVAFGLTHLTRGDPAGPSRRHPSPVPSYPGVRRNLFPTPRIKVPQRAALRHTLCRVDFAVSVAAYLPEHRLLRHRPPVQRHLRRKQ